MEILKLKTWNWYMNRCWVNVLVTKRWNPLSLFWVNSSASGAAECDSALLWKTTAAHTAENNLVIFLIIVSISSMCTVSVWDFSSTTLFWWKNLFMQKRIIWLNQVLGMQIIEHFFSCLDNWLLIYHWHDLWARVCSIRRQMNRYSEGKVTWEMKQVTQNTDFQTTLRWHTVLVWVNVKPF